MEVLLRGGLFRQLAQDLVQQVARSAAVGGGDAPDLAQAERIELVGVVLLLAGVHLVHGEDDRLLAAAQQVGDLGVVVSDPGGGFHHEEDHVGLVDGDDHLLADLLLEGVVRAGGPAAGVDDREFGAAPFAFAVMAVAGYARGLIDNGLAHADQPVEEGGLAHVRASYDGYKTHFSFFSNGYSPHPAQDSL